MPLSWASQPSSAACIPQECGQRITQCHRNRQGSGAIVKRLTIGVAKLKFGRAILGESPRNLYCPGGVGRLWWSATSCACFPTGRSPVARLQSPGARRGRSPSRQHSHYHSDPANDERPSRPLSFDTVPITGLATATNHHVR